VLPNEAAPEDYLPLLSEAPARIDAALHYVEEQHPSPVFLIAHSMGVTMATYYLGQTGDAPVRGLVAIGAEAGGEGSLDSKAAQFARLQLPVLDLYGENDLVPVLSGADTRAAVAAAAGNLNYVQIEAPDADHFFNGFEPQLLEVVSAWLEQQR